MQVIEDYFLLIDNNNPLYQIEPITERVDNSIESIGLRIKRKLLNGYLYIEIKGANRDDNEATFLYSLSPLNDNYLESIDMPFGGYWDDNVRDIVRTIFIIDKNPSQYKTKCVPIAA